VRNQLHSIIHVLCLNAENPASGTRETAKGSLVLTPSQAVTIVTVNSTADIIAPLSRSSWSWAKSVFALEVSFSSPLHFRTPNKEISRLLPQIAARSNLAPKARVKQPL
jgi:hypothetical protein